MVEKRPPVGSYAPLFRDPVALCGDAHRYHGFIQKPSPDHMASFTALPLGLAEFHAASRHYPLVFSPGPIPVPLAITGLAQSVNLFIDRNEVWRSDCYIPAPALAYPFILGDAPQIGQGMMMVDNACPRFVDTRQAPEAVRLFDDSGEPSALMREITTACTALRQEEMRTISFCATLRETGVLAEGRFEYQLKSGEMKSAGGFYCIDEKVYRKLPVTTLAQWFSQGWLDAIAFHLASQKNWNTLAALENDRLAATGRLP